MTRIEGALATALKLERGEKESDDAWRRRLAKASCEIPEEEWDKIPEEIQDWANALIAAVREKRDNLPAPPDQPKEEPAPAGAKTGGEESKVKGKKKQAAGAKPKAKGKKKPEPKAKKAKAPVKKPEQPKAGKAPKAKGTSPGRKASRTGKLSGVIEIIARNPEASKEEVRALAEKAGHRISETTLPAVYYYVRATIDALKKIGK